MSQSQNPTDSQALLQSMLQKLKLQQGRENQPVFNPYASSSSEEQQHEERRASPPLNREEISPVSHPTRNGSPFNFSSSAVGNSVGFQDGDEHGGIASLPSQKHISEGRDTSWPGLTPTGVKQLFPAQAHKDADITSCETTDAKRTISSSDAPPNNLPANTYSISDKGPSLDQDQQFTPRVYMWSQKSSDSHTEEQGGKVLQSGGFDAADVPKSSNNNNFRNEKSSKRKPRRWTSKIKERWRYRQGSFGKKGKEDGNPAEQKNAQITDVNQVSLENPFNTLHEDGEKTLSPTEIPPAQEEDSTVDVTTRPTSDFDFGLGSFSLLEEITMGQEWAKFINPNLTTTTTQSGESLSQTGTPGSMWSFNGAESSSQATAQHSPDVSSPVSMDVSEGKQLQLSDQRQADQSEPMDDGVNQSSLRPAENGLDQQSRSLTSVKTTSMDRLYGSVQRSRLQLNRKRQHQSQIPQISDGEVTEGSETSRHAMDESEPPQTNSHPAPESASSSFYNPSAAPAPALRGVLKHSISWDRESQSKRRRLEVNRRVHFSVEVVTIASPVLDYSDSEEEEEEEEGEEDVVIEEAEVEQAPMQDVAPVRRHILPQWIMALKRKNTGKKHG